ncbi:MAG: beta-mannosidase [Bacteroidaceae bacterium]|nr:beta-mannosidase [Bacteroidaceae bacterium]
MKKHLFFLIAATILVSACSQNKYAHVSNGEFKVKGKAYRFVGVNFWYGAILGSQGEGGDRKRLESELDAMKELGITNLRILVGADGPLEVPAAGTGLSDADGSPFGQSVRSAVVQPTLQTAPGVYNQDLLDGLDWLMAELGKREMMAVLYLNNTWSWSGGYGQYLSWAHPESHAGTGRYYTDTAADSLFRNHVRFILGRTNRYNGLKYTEDPAIFSWQLGNEPRPLGRDNRQAFIDWIERTAKLIRSMDSNHMISTGNEGEMGCDNNMEIVRAINAIPEISYMTIHIWPFNWGWIRAGSVSGNLENAKEQTTKYIEMHLPVADEYGKPMVIEEFGYPRDGFKFKLGTSTESRDAYFSHVFSLLEKSRQDHSKLAGCNIWAWGGYAVPPADHDYWVKGDDYTGDPAMEQQGLNSVFMADKSTIGLIKEVNSKLK